MCTCVGHDKSLEVLLENEGDLTAGNAFSPLHCAV